MNKIQEALRGRFSHLHPLVFYRSMEKSDSPGELYDILQDYPKQYPVIWNDKLRRWKHIEDLLQSKQSEEKE